MNPVHVLNKKILVTFFYFVVFNLNNSTPGVKIWFVINKCIRSKEVGDSFSPLPVNLFLVGLQEEGHWE